MAYYDYKCEVCGCGVNCYNEAHDPMVAMCRACEVGNNDEEGEATEQFTEEELVLFCQWFEFVEGLDRRHLGDECFVLYEKVKSKLQ